VPHDPRGARSAGGALKRRAAIAGIVAALAALLTFAVGPGATQDPDGFLLSADHPAVEMVRRLEGLGYLSRQLDLGRRSYTAPEIRELLAEAAAGSESSAAGEALSRFNRLHGPANSRFRPWVSLSMAGASASADHHPGYFLHRQWRDPLERPAADSVLLRASAWLPLGPRTIVSLSTDHVGETDVSVRSAYVHQTLGGWSLWGGRYPVALGMRGRETQLLGAARIDGASIRRGEPLHPGDALRRIGPVTGELFFGRPVGDIGSYRDPFLTGARIALRPRRNVTLGLNRVTLFGGEGNDEPITPKNLVLMLIGFTSYFGKDTSFENSLASADLTVLTSIAETPLVLSAEWAFEDFGLSFLVVPGITLGAELPEVAALRDWSASLRHTRMTRSCCGYPSWYHHMDFGAGWVLDRQPLGHPLGGHGSETRFSATRSPLLDGVGVELSAGRRVRGRQNIYAPTLTGESWLADAGVEIGLSGTLRVGFSGAVELRRSGSDTHRGVVYGRIH
jgi:hypothetical protein